MPLSLAVSRSVSRLQNPLAPSMLLLKKAALRQTATALALIVVRADAGIMQEAAQLFSVIEPEDYSLTDRTSFPSQTPTFVLLDGVLFRERQHDLIDTVHQRRTVLPAVTQDEFELLLSAFTLLPGFRFFPAVELAQGCQRHAQQVLRECSSKRLAANSAPLSCVVMSAK